MSKKLKHYKVGMDSETYAISLVESPAIEEEFLAFSKDEKQIEMKLSEDEKHIVYGAVLVPDKDIYRNSNGNEFFVSFTKESIEKMSQEFMKEYRQHDITTDHEEEASEVFVVESWLKTDLFKDKSVALGLNDTLPVGTWFVGMKVNNIETWERIKSGELNGFSVESLISLEEFNKIENNDRTMTDDMKFWSKMKDLLAEVFAGNQEKNDEVEIVNEELAEEAPVEAVSEPSEPVSEPEPTVEPQESKEEPVEPKNEPEDKSQEEAKIENEAKVEEEHAKDNHLDDLVKSLMEEIETLKKMNTDLTDKVKEMGKQPSAEPLNVNAKHKANTYQAWREQMASMM